jgi:hypothetical protein
MKKVLFVNFLLVNGRTHANTYGSGSRRPKFTNPDPEHRNRYPIFLVILCTVPVSHLVNWVNERYWYRTQVGWFRYFKEDAVDLRKMRSSSFFNGGILILFKAEDCSSAVSGQAIPFFMGFGPGSVTVVPKMYTFTRCVSFGYLTAGD